MGVLARLIPEKGVLELVEELSDVSGSWSTLLVGGARQDEGYASRVEQRIEMLGIGDRVSLLGAGRRSAPTVLSQVDVFVVPSTGNEGQPTVIVEALAHGRSVLVRAPLWSREFEAFPVQPFGSASELGGLLGRVGRGQAVDRERVATEFGVKQVIDAFERAAGLAAVPV